MAIDTVSGLVIGSPEYFRFLDQREMAMQKASGLDNNLPVDVEAGTDNMQAMQGLSAADYSVGAVGSTYAPGLAAAEAELTKNKTAYEAKMTQDAEAAAEEEADRVAAEEAAAAEAAAAAAAASAKAAGAGKKVVSTIVNDKGENVAVYNDGTTQVLGQAVDKIAERKSAFDILKEEFTRYGLEGLIGDTKALAIEGVSPAEFTLRLRKTKTYTDRFKANEDRITAGYRSLSEAEYLALEDGYQKLMRAYGLPESFYKTETGTAGRQQS
jgi:hypothetical protein